MEHKLIIRKEIKQEFSSPKKEELFAKLEKAKIETPTLLPILNLAQELLEDKLLVEEVFDFVKGKKATNAYKMREGKWELVNK